MKKVKEDRIFLFDNIKFLLILLVVLGHYIDLHITNNDLFKGTYLFIYAFHMPLFIFISGMFHSNKNIKEKALSYLFIGIVLKIIIFLFNIIKFGKIPDFILLGGNDLAWFMFALSGMILLSNLLKDYDKKKILILFIIIAMFSGYDKNIGDDFAIARIITFYPFYLMGELLEPKKIIEIKKNKKIKILSITLLLVWLFECIFNLKTLYILRGVFTGHNPFDYNLLIYNLGFLLRFLYYIIATGLSLGIINICFNKKIPIITNIGKKTLQIYFWHWPVIIILEKLKVGKTILKLSYGNILIFLLSIIIVLITSLNIFETPIKQIKEVFIKKKEFKS